MKPKFWIFLFCSFLGMTTASYGSVNMRNGSYTEKWIDIINPGVGYNLSMERYYSSRSLFIGMFGFGWCSKFETKLEVTSLGELIITNCGGGLEATYYPQNFDPISAAKTTDNILKSIPSTARDVSNANRRSLKNRLLEDSFRRFQMAQQYQLIDGKSFLNRKAIFVSKRSKIDQVEFTGKFYIHRQSDGEIAKFDNKGRLIQLVDRLGNRVQLQYKASKLSFITDSNGRKLVFSYDTNKRVKKISNGRGLNVLYTYKGEDLTEVTNAWRNTYFFDYDRAHNMKQVSFPGGTSIKMAYNNKRDWIKGYNDRIGCTDTYGFVVSQDQPKDHYWSNLNRTCPKKSIQGKYEFWYQKHPNGDGKFLERVKTVVDRDRIDSLLHPFLGDPLKITGNNTIETFAYHNLGVKSQSELQAFDSKRKLLEKSALKFGYNKSYRKVTSVTQTVSKPKKSKPLKLKTFFKYSNKGLLRSAKRNNGVVINVAWNNTGKISEISGPKGKKLILKYSVDFPKPRVIQSSAGSIEISYTPTGEVLSVKSKKGKAIAAKVVREFVSYIDIIGPAVDGLEI